MTYAAPQTIENDLLRYITTASKHDAGFSDFERRRLMRGADQLARVDPCAAFMTRAAIAAIDWELQDVQLNTQKSLYLDRSARNLVNASLTYRLVNQIDMAAQLGVEALEANPMDEEVRERALTYLTWSGRWGHALTLRKRAQEHHWPLEPAHIDYSVFLQALQHRGVPQARLESELAAAYEVLRTNRRRVQSMGFELVVSEDGQESVLIELSFIGDMDDELRMESQLAQVFVDQPGWNPGALSVELRYTPEHAEQCA